MCLSFFDVFELFLMRLSCESKDNCSECFLCVCVYVCVGVSDCEGWDKFHYVC